MKKALVIVFSVFSFIAFAAIVLFTSYLISKSYEKNASEKERAFPVFKTTVVEWFAEAKSFKSELFENKAKAAMENDPQFIALYIYSKKDGILFWGEKRLFGTGRYLKGSGTGTISSASSIPPEYDGLPFGSETVTLRLMETPSGEIYMDGIYWPFDLAEISQYVKWGFFVLFVWLILSVIVRLFVSTKSMREIYELDDANYKAGVEPKKPPVEPAAIAGEAYHPQAADEEDIETESRGESLEEVKRDSSIGLFSPNTGLGWQDHLAERLKFEINRTASFNQDMAFAFISIDDFDRLHDSFTVYKDIAKLILNSFPFQDLAFEYGKDGYALILPDTDIQQGIKLLDQFRRKISKTDFGKNQPTVSIGLSSRNGRLLSETTLIQETEKALLMAKKEGKQRIIAFKADADKYRQVIADKL